MNILNVAEKPSVAKSISRILSTHCSTSRGLHKYCPNIYLETEVNGSSLKMIFTSVLGHLLETSFEEQGKWNESDPKDLLYSRIVKKINPEHKQIEANLKRQALNANMLIIWTDCDREGENIASQIESIVTSVKDIEVRRARFSAISKTEIFRALENLQDINYLESAAVNARIELDLRIGSAFTRLQTISYNKQVVLSFGPCQIPTLNFVVQRHRQIENFKPEAFYSLKNKINNDEFTWVRKNIFDKNCVIHFYNLLADGKAVIIKKNVNNKEKYRPLPLRTVEFQKICSSYYKIDSHRLMTIAEKLYNSGYISYPRTETDSFPKSFGFTSIVNKLKEDNKLGEYAEIFEFKYPRSGSNNDQAHSPIYPLKAGSDLQGEDRKVYEFIARRFLGCISDNAKGLETDYVMRISHKSWMEDFTCKGLIITERNYLDVYIYDKWESKEIGDYRENQVVENNLELTEGKTSKPEYLTESDLINLMDKNGIGTDATIHEHIHKIQVRGYAKKEKFKFIPLNLGINLIDSYNSIGLPISEPTLRKNLEENLKKVCEGQKDKVLLVKEEIEEYARIYDKFFQNISTFKDIMSRGGGDNNAGSGPGITRKTASTLSNMKGGKSASKRSLDDDQRDASNYEESSDSGRSDDDYSGNKYKKLSANNKNTKKASNVVQDDYSSEDHKYISKSKQKAEQPIKGVKPELQNVLNSLRKNEASKGVIRDKAISKENKSNIQEQDVKCDCKLSAKLLEARKGDNSGKEFYTCHHYPKKCTFFQWKDAVPTKVSAKPSMGTTTQKRNQSDIIVNCFCNYEAQVKVANTESNKGRSFYCCKKSYKKCNFFQWVDE